jgi:ATP-dependent protease HslVU (ClpYQ) peptidase subunit
MRVEIPHDETAPLPFRVLRDYPLHEYEPPHSRAWGCGVTTCIVAVSFEKNFVSASDTRLSFGSRFAVDDVIKAEPFHGEWVAMIGGNDVSQAVMVIEKAARILRGKGNDFPTVVNGFKQAYREHYEETVADEFLIPYQMTLREFKRSGRKLLNPEVHADISIRMRHYDMGCAFLVYGYDQKKQPHIFEVRSPGKVSFHDKPGFWAIGAGASSALSMLALLGQAREVTRLPATIYNVLAAKFVSETASDVGPKTFFMVQEYGSYAFSVVGVKLEQRMRQLWDEVGRPRVPTQVDQIFQGIDISFWNKYPNRKRKATPSISRMSKLKP